MTQRTGGRAVEGARLESVYTFIAYRGVESPSVRQNYFELIPIRSNNLVFEPVQHFTHDLQVLRALAEGAPALKACD